MIVGALDISLRNIGWARSLAGSALGDPWESGVIHPRGKGIPRLGDGIARVVRQMRGCHLIVVEGYAYGIGGKKGQGAAVSRAHSLGEMGGVVKLGLWQLQKPTRIPIVEIAPKSLKKYATGNGNASKMMVCTEAVRRFAYPGSDDNEADALWLLQMALAHYELEGAVAVPAKNRAALEAVQWAPAPWTGGDLDF